MSFQPCLRCSSHDPLHSETCAQRGLSLVVGQCDGGSLHGMLAVHRQQEGTGGADQLELLRRICRIRQTEKMHNLACAETLSRTIISNSHFLPDLSLCQGDHISNQDWQWDTSIIFKDKYNSQRYMIILDVWNICLLCMDSYCIDYQYYL